MTASNTIKLSDIATIKNICLHQVRADDLIINITDKGKIIFLSVFDDVSKILSSDSIEDYNSLKFPLKAILGGRKFNRAPLSELNGQSIYFRDLYFEKKKERQLLDSFLVQKVNIIRLSDSIKSEYLPDYIKKELNNSIPKDIAYLSNTSIPIDELKSYKIKSISKNDQIKEIYKNLSLINEDIMRTFSQWKEHIGSAKPSRFFSPEADMVYFFEILEKIDNAELKQYYKDLIIFFFSLRYTFILHNYKFPNPAINELSKIVNINSDYIINNFYLDILLKSGVSFDFFEKEWKRISSIPLAYSEDLTKNNYGIPRDIIDSSFLQKKPTLPTQHIWPEITEDMFFNDIFNSFISAWHTTKILFCNNILRLLSEDLLPIKELASQYPEYHFGETDKGIIINYIGLFLFRILEHLKKISDIKIDNKNENYDKQAENFIGTLEIFKNTSSFFEENCDAMINENIKINIFDAIVLARIVRAMPFIESFIGERRKKEEIQIRADEREDIMQALSHNIKGLIDSAVKKPLILMKMERHFSDREIIDDAIRGANLINEIVSSINISKKGSKDDLIEDLTNTDDKSLSFISIIAKSMEAAISKIFDEKFFEKYYDAYFPINKTYEEAFNEFIDISKNDIDGILTFCNKYLAITKLICHDDIANIKIGNKNKSSLKMILLFQELFMNALKNTSFLEKEKRFISIKIEKNIKIMITNSYIDSINNKDTMIGSAIIDNFLTQFEAIDVKTTAINGIFAIQFSIDINLT